MTTIDFARSMNERSSKLPDSKKLFDLTNNDVKVLGKFLEKRAKTLPPEKFQTRMFKTHNSNWTPIVNKASNEQIFKERKELIVNWFDLWTGAQRRQFLDLILFHCADKQLAYIHGWFTERVPLQHLDFTTVLPRFLSLYIFSFLDPRSLCRAASVSWHWKFLSDQDVLWMPKCLRHGWFLPYKPSSNEYGAWKIHYVACLQTLDFDPSTRNLKASSLQMLQIDSEIINKNSKSARNLFGQRSLRTVLRRLGSEILESRPPWMPPDKNPKDLEKALKAVLGEFNPNDPEINASLLLHHDKFGSWKSSHVWKSFYPGMTEPSDFGLNSLSRKSGHRMAEENMLPDENRKVMLSKSLQLENYEEQRLMELLEIKSDPPIPNSPNSKRRRDLSGGVGYTFPWNIMMHELSGKNFPAEEHPRLLLISSRVPAAEVLMDAVLFGIIPIVYEYEGTTLESLLYRIEQCLHGRLAKSIGIFVNCHLPWEMRLVLDANVTVDNYEKPEFINFFENISSHTLTPANGGHVDIFVPLNSNEPGSELLTHLSRLTGMLYCSPTGIAGKFNRIDSEWSSSPEGIHPTLHYFCRNKLLVWSNVAEQAMEACIVSTKLVSKYFEQFRRDVVSQLVGQVIYDAVGLAKTKDINQISELLVDGLIHVGEDTSIRDPVETLAKFLLDISGKANLLSSSTSKESRLSKPAIGSNSIRDQTMKPATISRHGLDDKLNESFESGSSRPTEEDLEVAKITTDDPAEVNFSKNGFEEEDSKSHSGMKEGSDISRIPQENGHTRSSEKFKTQSGPKSLTDSLVMSKSHLNSNTVDWLGALHLSRTGKEGDSSVLSRKAHVDTSDKRTAIFKEILASEVEYMKVLQIIEKVFYLPCEAALASNRAIISAQNVQLLFRDCMKLLNLTSCFVSDLQLKMSDWGAHQCVGEVFVKYSTKSKIYVDYLKNYPLILRTYDRCIEQSPVFRMFVKRHERTPETKMLTLPEILLAPTQRIRDYITLLSSFQQYNCDDHADRKDVGSALRILLDLDQLMQQNKLRGEQERNLLSLQKSIINCPVLLEANRFFIKQFDVAGLESPVDSVVPEFRVYRHVETLGLYLFNDSLLVTRRKTYHLPFERSKEHRYTFTECASLTRLRVEDIADSKYVSNAFRMYTPKREWICGAETAEDKMDWITVLERTIRSSIQENE